MSSPEPFLFEPTCSYCGRRATRLEIFPPGTVPSEWDEWNDELRQQFEEWREGDGYIMRYEGIEAGDGDFGTPATEEEVLEIISALSPDFDADVIRSHFYDSLGYCHECRTFYCRIHWKVSSTAGGRCPKGHFKSLDPHWSPEW